MVLVRPFVTVHHRDTEGTENSHGEQQKRLVAFLRASLCLCVSVVKPTLVSRDAGSVRSLAANRKRKSTKDTKKMMRDGAIESFAPS
jgi:hypothetical protein